MIEFLKNRIKSFKFALEGFSTLFKDEPNFRIHLLATVITLSIGLYLHITPLEWAIITLCIGLVLFAEAINTSIETLCDNFCEENNSHIKKIKDTAAFSVLVLAITAAIIGAIIFLPYIF